MKSNSRKRFSIKSNRQSVTLRTSRKGQRKETTSSSFFSPSSSFIPSLSTAGQPLPPSTQHFFKARMGYDFSHVKIHTGKEAESSAAAINAKAYTSGEHIVFNRNEYDPHSFEGQKLLAHELTHVTQSKQQKAPNILNRSISIQSPYNISEDFEPSAQYKKQEMPLGRTEPFLNGVLQLPSLGAGVFEKALQLPMFSKKDLNQISRPDLSDPSLNPVRANWMELSKSQVIKKSVKLVQQALIAWGKGLDNEVDLLPKYGADGIFLTETHDAVVYFQEMHPGLEVDGIVGDLTLSELQKEMDNLHGIIFTLQTVGQNNFTGLIHIPPPPLQWKKIMVDAGEFDSNKSLSKLTRDMIAIERSKKCSNTTNKFLLSFLANGNVPASILTHERVHETDQVKTIYKHVSPWDTNLNIAKLFNFKTKAADEKEAASKLYKTFGIPEPNQLSVSVIEEWKNDNQKFHKSPEGAGVKIGFNVPDCSHVEIIYG